MMSVEMPKGRTPPLCVYRCWMPEELKKAEKGDWNWMVPVFVS